MLHEKIIKGHWVFKNWQCHFSNSSLVCSPRNLKGNTNKNSSRWRKAIWEKDQICWSIFFPAFPNGLLEHNQTCPKWCLFRQMKKQKSQHWCSQILINSDTIELMIMTTSRNRKKQPSEKVPLPATRAKSHNYRPHCPVHSFIPYMRII